MKLRSTVTASALLACLSLVSPSWAQDVATDVSEEEAATARQLFDEGVKAQQAKDFEKARDLFRRSYNIKRSYDTAANLGQVEAKLGLYRDAAEHLNYCLRQFPTAENQRFHANVKKLFEKVRPHVAAVSVTVDRPEATIYVDEKVVGTSPLHFELFVNPGEHTVRAQSEEGQAKESFSADKGASLDIELSLSGSSTSAPGSLTEAPETGTTGEPVDMTSESGPSWTPAWVLGGVTVVSLGTSLVFRALASDQASQNEELRQDLPAGGCPVAGSVCDELNATASQHDDYAQVSDVSLVVAGIGAAATLGYVTYVLMSDSDEGGPDVQASVGVGNGSGMFMLRGNF